MVKKYHSLETVLPKTPAHCPRDGYQRQDFLWLAEKQHQLAKLGRLRLTDTALV
jgi:hypothetical protein